MNGTSKVSRLPLTRARATEIVREIVEDSQRWAITVPYTHNQNWRELAMRLDEGVSAMTKSGKNVYHYRDCGLENVFLEGGFKVVDTPYGKGVTITDLDGLHSCIADCLIKKPMPLNGKEFRFLRTELDLSQTTMGDLCGRKERRLRDWEKNNEKVPDPANTIIRIVYKERYDPNVTFEGLSKDIRSLQALDRKVHEIKLVSTADGWREKQFA